MPVVWMRHMTPSTVTAGVHLRHACGAAARRVARRATAGTSPRAMALAMPLAMPPAGREVHRGDAVQLRLG